MMTVSLKTTMQATFHNWKELVLTFVLDNSPWGVKIFRDCDKV